MCNQSKLSTTKHGSLSVWETCQGCIILLTEERRECTEKAIALFNGDLKLPLIVNVREVLHH